MSFVATQPSSAQFVPLELPVVPQHRCAICLDDYAPWNMIETCVLKHSFCKGCAGQLVHGHLTPNCPMCRTPMKTPAYFPPKTFDAPIKLPDMSLLEYTVVDVTGPDPIPSGLTTAMAVFFVIRRDANAGIFTIRQLCKPAAIGEIRAATGRLSGRHPAATIRRSVQELRRAHMIDFMPGDRTHYYII
tara:strand:+ start:1566 stop:2129 length:564 start_codon:yes stop_codon:yes gene_type:complete